MGCDVFQISNGNITQEHINASKFNNNEEGDHVGAGDSFVAGFIYGLVQGWDYQRCARIGSVTASFILEKKGCLDGAPILEDILNREKENYG